MKKEPNNKSSEKRGLELSDFDRLNQLIEKLQSIELTPEVLEDQLLEISDPVCAIITIEAFTKNQLTIIRKFVNFCCDLMKQRVNDKIKEIILRFFIEVLLNNKTILRIMKEDCLGYLKDLYKSGFYNPDLMNLLIDCGYEVGVL